MKVFVVHSEWEEFADGGNSIIHGVFSTATLANIRETEIRKYYKDLGRQVYSDDVGGWDFDTHIEEVEVDK